jgi:TolB protein
MRTFLLLVLVAPTLVFAQAKRITTVIDSYPQLSRDGTTIVFQSNRSGSWQIYKCKPDGSALEQLTKLPFAAAGPSWSPNGRLIAFAGEPGGDSEIFVMNSDGSDVRQLTSTPGDDSHPHFSADGSRIMFNSARTSADLTVDWSRQWHELFSMKPDGSDVRQHTRCRSVCTFGSFSPDMTRIVYRKVIDGPAFQWDLTSRGRNSEIFVANADGTNEVNLSNNAAFDGWPMWSPDGRQVVFASNRSGPANTGRIYVANVDVPSVREVNTGPGSFVQPSWSADGRRIVLYQHVETAEYEYGNIALVEIH